MADQPDPLPWDYGDEYCEHGSWIIYKDHLYCYQCACWMGPTELGRRHGTERPQHGWKYVLPTGDGELYGLDYNPYARSRFGPELKWPTERSVGA